tara:strand:+ start:570 stop:1400 length:831 start_codon:yes stop_codon:yes gene_type:complete
MLIIPNLNIMKRIFPLLLISLLVEQANATCVQSDKYNGIAECTYTAFNVLLSCSHKAAILSYAENVTVDNGRSDTSSRSYKLDDTAEELNCQQSSYERYAPVNSIYDVGHLTAIDIFDHDKDIALETNVMTNIVPQARSFDRTGAWKRTETLLECYRDEDGYPPLKVFSGVIFGTDSTNDHFSGSHNLPQTPDYLWKLIYSESKREYDAWIMLNDNSSNVASLKSSRRNLDALVTALESQNNPAYLPVIEKLTEIKEASPKFEELKWNSRCHHRKG